MRAAVSHSFAGDFKAVSPSTSLLQVQRFQATDGQTDEVRCHVRHLQAKWQRYSIGSIAKCLSLGATVSLQVPLNAVWSLVLPF